MRQGSVSTRGPSAVTATVCSACAARLPSGRGGRSIVAVAGAAGVSRETLRKIETGRILTPAFFTVAALSDVLDMSLDVLVDATADGGNAVVR
ncbi:MAG: helix-turn-helix domain-containing protein [Pseudonocardiaceae bacterium]|nr:helix-turn-helix domain-containing protein [Pseudonocardiaceae bacterium]